jgi:uncharacterized membrane protein
VSGTETEAPKQVEIRKAPLGSFRVRGHSPSRLEAFSDAVFGFSATLLVVSLEVPRTFSELVENLRGFGAFGLSFLALVFIWSAHNGFFRRYGLRDSWTTVLNMVLLFVVLFFVYPLKFLSVSFVEQVFHVRQETLDPGVSKFTSEAQVESLFVIYGLAFAAVFLCLALFYRRALAKRAELELNAVEVYDAKSIFWHYMLMVLMAFVSVSLALIGVGERLGGVAGWIYGLLGPVITVFWIRRSKQRARLEASLET